jgi:hypothetical protein
MSAFQRTLLLITLSLTPLFAQDPAPRITLQHTRGETMIKLPGAHLTNAWRIEASADLNHWTSLGEMLEINGRGDFPDLTTQFVRKRYYRAIHDGNNIQATLDRNRNRWENSDIANYDFTFRWSCFCVPDYTLPVNISVRNSVITAITRVGRELSESEFVNYPTFDGLFDFLQDALDRDPHRITARFDGRTGVPLNGSVDYIEFLADEERGFAVENFRINGAPPVQISDTPPKEIQLDPFSLQSATVRGDTLTINLQYGGGCAEHDFQLFMSPGAFLESSPVQANLYLRHNAHGDACRALLTRELIFDLTPISHLYGRPDPILLNIYDYFPDTPGKRIQVIYE